MSIQHRLSLSWRLTLLVVLLFGLVLPQPASAASTWTPVASMNTAREYPAATLLPNGMILVVGGYGASGILDSAEVYDPATNIWTTVASMHTARHAHTATLLPNGKLLVVGGSTGSSGTTGVEVYDPGATPGRRSPR